MNKSKIRNIIKESFKSVFQETYDLGADYELEKFVIDAIDLSGHDKSNVSDSKKIEEFYDIFLDEKSWHIKRVGPRKALEEYLRGLPSTINLPIYYDNVRNFMYATGYNEVESMDNEELDNFYYKKIVEVILDNVKS